MDYQKIMENIMFQFSNTQEVDKYLVDIMESQRVLVLDSSEYIVFITLANLYIKIREELEITPELRYIEENNGKRHDASVVFGNLRYASKRISEILISYLNRPIQQITC